MTSGGVGEPGDGGAESGAAQGDTALRDPSLEALLAAHEELTLKLGAYDTSVTSTDDLAALLVRTERVSRSMRGVAQTWLQQVVEQHGLENSGVSNTEALSQLLHLDTRMARRRLAEAEQLGERMSLVGEPMDPELPETATALRDGDIDVEHVRVIRQFLKDLPTAVDAGTRQQAQAQLAELARQLTPRQLRMVADRLAAHIAEDGNYKDPKDRVRKRSARLSRQGADGMSTLVAVVDPEGRAIIEAIWGFLAEPGQNVPDQKPTEQEPPSEPTEPTEPEPPSDDPNEPAAERDSRTQPQRRYDALMTCWRRILARRDLGATHRGVPYALVATMTLDALLEQAGLATTSGGSFIPIDDLLRLAADNPDAHRYLCVFGSDSRPLYLGRAKRIATADQRLALFAAERGCSFPGCDAPATHCQLHHVTEWARDGVTDVDAMTHACDRHHRLVHDGPLGWATSVAPPGHPFAGRTLWHPPAVADPARTGRTNHYFHPEDYLLGKEPP